MWLEFNLVNLVEYIQAIRLDFTAVYGTDEDNMFWS